MAVRGGIVLWGVWGGFPPIIGRTWPPVRREGGFGGDPPPHYRGKLQAGSFHHGRVADRGQRVGDRVCRASVRPETPPTPLHLAR